jgi:hypothetical protein
MSDQQPADKARLFEVTIPLNESYPKGTQVRRGSVTLALEGAPEIANAETGGVDAPTMVEVEHV